MVSASYHVQAGRCAVGEHEDEYAGARELWVLDLHYGEKPSLRPVRNAQEIGICLEHWRQAEEAIDVVYWLGRSSSVLVPPAPASPQLEAILAWMEERTREELLELDAGRSEPPEEIRAAWAQLEEPERWIVRGEHKARAGLAPTDFDTMKPAAALEAEKPHRIRRRRRRGSPMQ